MNLPPVLFRLAAAGFAALVLAGCEYEAPLTAQPTGKIDPRLVGDWRSIDGKDLMRVRAFDESRYAISYNSDVYAAWHSDFAPLPLISVLHLDPRNRKYSFLTWDLSAGDGRLRLQVINSKVVPKDLPDPAALQQALLARQSDAALYVHRQDYLRER
jgi:hypothetical protein